MDSRLLPFASGGCGLNSSGSIELAEPGPTPAARHPLFAAAERPVMALSGVTCYVIRHRIDG
jgi:hypothetical protein